MHYEQGYRHVERTTEHSWFGKWITVSKDITAIQLRPAESEKEHLSAISELPPGSELKVCDKGFNSRSVKVRCSGQLYYVFVQDLEHTAQGHWESPFV